MSLPSKRINAPVGVTTTKKITPMITGETMDPKIAPSLNHNILSGLNNFEFKTSSGTLNSYQSLYK